MMHLIRILCLNKGLFLAALSGTTMSGFGCTYRFSNSFQRGTSVIRTMCVESIYSTAREVVPYQHIWDAVQKRIALDGTFFVDSCSQADAIVVGHLVEASISASGEPDSVPEVKTDPKVFDPISASQADFRRLESARKINKSQDVGYLLKVDVHNLRTRALIFSKIYSRSEKFLTYLDHKKIADKREFPIAEESLDNRSRSIGVSLANQIVSDLRSNLLR